MGKPEVCFSGNSSLNYVIFISHQVGNLFLGNCKNKSFMQTTLFCFRPDLEFFVVSSKLSFNTYLTFDGHLRQKSAS